MPEADDLHEQLKSLLDASSMRWTYAIFWRCSSHRSVLNFHDGYYKGTGKTKAVRILGSSVTVTEEVTDAEWFFKISMAQSFTNKEDLPGHAFFCLYSVWVTAADSDSWRWKRAKWGNEFGIKTLLCIPLWKKGVLELGSSEIIPYDFGRIKEMESFISPIGIPRFIFNPPALKLFGLDESSHEKADNEMQNHGNDNLHKQFRGKEKISDSKCFWPIPTESSDRGTDRTFSYSHEYSGPS